MLLKTNARSCYDVALEYALRLFGGVTKPKPGTERYERFIAALTVATEAIHYDRKLSAREVTKTPMQLNRPRPARVGKAAGGTKSKSP